MTRQDDFWLRSPLPQQSPAGARRRGEHPGLGFSLQLTTVRYVRTFLPDPLDVPTVVLERLAGQRVAEISGAGAGALNLDAHVPHRRIGDMAVAWAAWRLLRKPEPSGEGKGVLSAR